VFPTVETVLAQVGAGVFVIGSYLLAERIQGRPTRRRVPARAERGAAEQGSVTRTVGSTSRE
jgi:hypothetical protein